MWLGERQRETERLGPEGERERRELLEGVGEVVHDEEVVGVVRHVREVECAT